MYILYKLKKNMKHILVIFIFDEQGKVYLTEIDEYTRRTIFYQYITEIDTYNINDKIKYLLKERIELKYKRTRLFDIGIGESKEKEYKYYLYCYKIMKIMYLVKK